MNGTELDIGQALIIVVSVQFVNSDNGVGYFIFPWAKH